MSFQGLLAHFILLLNNIPLSECLKIALTLENTSKACPYLALLCISVVDSTVTALESQPLRWGRVLSAALVCWTELHV